MYCSNWLAEWFSNQKIQVWGTLQQSMVADYLLSVLTTINPDHCWARQLSVSHLDGGLLIGESVINQAVHLWNPCI